MTTYYVVSRSRGEWSDRQSWMCAAYCTEDQAKRHVEAGDAALAAWFARSEEERDRLTDWCGDNEKNYPSALDPEHGFDAHEDSDRFYYGQVVLLEEVPT